MYSAAGLAGRGDDVVLEAESLTCQLKSGSFAYYYD